MTTWQEEEQRIADLEANNKRLKELAQGQAEAITRLYDVCESYRKLVWSLLEEVADKE